MAKTACHPLTPSEAILGLEQSLNDQNLAGAMTPMPLTPPGRPEICNFMKLAVGRSFACCEIYLPKASTFNLSCFSKACFQDCIH